MPPRQTRLILKQKPFAVPGGAGALSYPVLVGWAVGVGVNRSGASKKRANGNPDDAPTQRTTRA
jgi:hypothetical protein